MVRLRCGLINPCAACELFGPTGLGYPDIMTAGPLMQYCHNKAHEEMRRYLYRNVPCECPGTSIYLWMPDVPGWS